MKKELRRRKDESRARESLASFTRAAWDVIEPNRTFVDGWHIGAICEHLEALRRGEIRNLIIEMPPGHMKSLLVSVLFQAWVWIDQPETRWLFASYAHTLSERDSVRTRRIIESDWYRGVFEPKWNLAYDQNQKARFNNDREGYRISTSVHGTGTGEKGDYVCWDDPHKLTDVYSDTKRNKVIEWHDEEWSTRGIDPKTVRKLGVMQRLHMGDLAGHCRRKTTYEFLTLPAEYEGKKFRTCINWEDPRTKTGDLIWPEMAGPKEVATMKKDLGPQGWAAQGQQNPTPAKGAIVDRSMWKFYRELPNDLETWIQSWDLPFKGTEHSSYAVGQVWGRKKAHNYLIAQYRQQVGFNGQLGAVRVMTTNWPKAGGKYFEDAANASALTETIKSEIAGAILWPVHGSKEARARAVSPQIASGNIWLPHPEVPGNEWVLEFIEEWQAAPDGPYMDQVDASSQAISVLGGVPTTDCKPISVSGPSKWRK